VAAAGTTPRLSWSTPATFPTGSYFRVEILPIAVVGGTPRVGFSAALTALTASNSFQVPPGILRTDTSYLARIIATYAPQQPFDREPFRSGGTTATAVCVTAPFTP
jgi:hypothetical protein